MHDNLNAPNYNGFGGFDHGETQVLKSPAGYYIGDLYYDDGMGGWFPWSRDSAEYWETRGEAEAVLANGVWTPHIF